jgi:DNA-binding transcriptional LysR family regulator
MDLNKVAVFLRVVESQSFTAAAIALGVPKSTVSRSVAQLEEALGVRLLQRTTRKLSLTDAGVTYYERGSRALADLAQASAAVSDMQGTPHGTVRVTAPVDLGLGVLGDIIARFVRRYPGIRVDLDLSARTVDLVAEGFDLALRAGRLSDSSLVARKVGVIAARLFATPAYLRRRGAPGSVADLASHDCVLFRPRGEKTEWQLTGPSGAESVEVTGPIAANDLAFVQKMVLAGMGIGLVPWFLCAREMERKQLVHILPGYTAPGGSLHLVYPSSRHVPQRVALFRDFVIENLLRLPWDE